jgi:hypothetical protein
MFFGKGLLCFPQKPPLNCKQKAGQVGIGNKNGKILTGVGLDFFLLTACGEVNLSFSRKKYGYSKECVFGYRY